jgi:hypothetical protein
VFRDAGYGRPMYVRHMNWALFHQLCSYVCSIGWQLVKTYLLSQQRVSQISSRRNDRN